MSSHGSDQSKLGLGLHEKSKLFHKDSAKNEDTDVKDRSWNYGGTTVLQEGGKQDHMPKFTDQTSEMTYSRRLASFLSRYSWYNPNAGIAESLDKPNPPSIDQAWSFFEHMTLPRYIVQAGKGRGNLTRAEVGESSDETRLYPVLSTPETDLADFGVGTGIYFFLLRGLAIITFLSGLISVPLMKYYGSMSYDDGKNESNPIFQYSGMCSAHSWEACPTCSSDQWDDLDEGRYAETMLPNGNLLKFIKSNNCKIPFAVGIHGLIALLFTFLAIYYLTYYVPGKKIKEFDESEQTASDYTVCVTNPPGDATDINEWRDFFEQVGCGHVTCCTVALDNEELTHALIERRALLNSIEVLITNGKHFNKFNLDQAVKDSSKLTWWQSKIYDPAETIFNRICALDEEIEKLSRAKYPATSVFVTFESEETQRRVMRTLLVSKYDSWKGNKAALPSELLFRSTHLLAIVEPSEPLSIRWTDLDDTFLTKLKLLFISYTVSFGFIIGGGFLIIFAEKEYGTGTAALVITALNTITPRVCYAITDIESHANEGRKQASLFVKMAVLLCLNTTYITFLTTPLYDTTNDGEESMIRSLGSIYFYALIQGPAIYLLDPFGNFYRHVMGPRASTQSRMNLLFQGAFSDLSSRYTAMGNIFFLTCFYSIIFPFGFFYASAVFVVQYWTDKFCLLRNWTTTPRVGTQTTEFSRIFFGITLMIYALMSSYYISSIPYDNACEANNLVNEEYLEAKTATVSIGGIFSQVPISIPDNSKTYYFCDEDMKTFNPLAFFTEPSTQRDREWMNSDQEKITSIYDGVAALIIIICIIMVFNRAVITPILRFFWASYKPVGRTNSTKFSEVIEIYGYIPQARIYRRPFPLLLCDISNVSPDHLGWTDPFRGTDHHNVINDIPGLLNKTSDDGSPLFSIVKEWPPIADKTS